MIEIKFYNELGEVNFGRDKWKLTAAEGLDLPARSFRTAVYNNTSGAEIVDTLVSPRTITLKGDAFSVSNEEYSRVLKILYKKGTFEITAHGKSRRIKAVCSQFSPLERKGKYQLFVVQFLCENPYFEDVVAREVSIFRVIPYVNSEFTFPGMFSKRIVQSNIEYEGSAPAEPIFHIFSGNKPEGTLSIINHTSGESLSLDYTPFANESITVDVKHRKIFNSAGDNLLKYLTDNSFFDGFCLYPGINEIEVQLGTFREDLVITCSYSEMYLEAVI